MDMQSFWIQIVGTKDTGKTTLLENLTRELVRRGRTVCYVKHTHQEPPADHADTDTGRLADAGAAVSVLAGATSTRTFRSSGEERIESISFREAPPGEIVLAEGFKSVPGKKIAVVGGDLDVAALEDVVAVVGPAPEGFRGRSFDPGETREMADFIEELAAFPQDQTWATRILVDGREIPLNAFVQEVLASTLKGFCSSLREAGAERTIEVRCRIVREQEPSGDPGID
jgi:molybdopterin-guanine dinucleotide biosynthesis protein MobB